MTKLETLLLYLLKKQKQQSKEMKAMKKELELLLNNETRIAAIKKDYTALKDWLSQGGNASAKAASSIINFLRQ